MILDYVAKVLISALAVGVGGGEGAGQSLDRAELAGERARLQKAAEVSIDKAARTLAAAPGPLAPELRTEVAALYSDAVRDLAESYILLRVWEGNSNVEILNLVRKYASKSFFLVPDRSRHIDPALRGARKRAEEWLGNKAGDRATALAGADEVELVLADVYPAPEEPDDVDGGDVDQDATPEEPEVASPVDPSAWLRLSFELSSVLGGSSQPGVADDAPSSVPYRYFSHSSVGVRARVLFRVVQRGSHSFAPYLLYSYVDHTFARRRLSAEDVGMYGLESWRYGWDVAQHSMIAGGAYEYGLPAGLGLRASAGLGASWLFPLSAQGPCPQPYFKDLGCEDGKFVGRDVATRPVVDLSVGLRVGRVLVLDVAYAHVFFGKWQGDDMTLRERARGGTLQVAVGVDIAQAVYLLIGTRDEGVSPRS